MEWNKARNRSGQAATEMAIFGSLVIMVFGIWLSYAQTFTEQQALQQQSFRMALRRAYGANDEQGGFVSYNIMKNHRTPNLSGGLNQGNRESVSAGSTVLWAVSNPESYSYQQINEDLVEIPRINKEMKEGEDQETPEEVWNIETATQTEYSANELKREGNREIRTTRSSSNRDTITTRLKTRYQTEEDGDYYDGADLVVSQRLDIDGRYGLDALNNNVVVVKERSWETLY